VSWTNSTAGVQVNVIVPVNTQAMLWFPGQADQVYESSNIAKESVRFVRQEGAESIWQVGSGQYTFATKS